MANRRSRSRSPTSVQAVWSISALTLTALYPSNSYGACFFSESNNIGYESLRRRCCALFSSLVAEGDSKMIHSIRSARIKRA